MESNRPPARPTLVAVAKSTFARGYRGPGSVAPAAYAVRELREALMDTYATDAHLVTYVVDGAKTQPRINKAGLPYFNGRVTVGVFFCDVDNPDHREWDDELLVAACRDRPKRRAAGQEVRHEVDHRHPTVEDRRRQP